MNIKRPLLRYHGGKFLLSDWIISHFPSHKVYIEPFGGAGSVLLRKGRSYAEIYNDIDAEIVNVFKQLRERPEELKAMVYATPFSRLDFIEAYKPADTDLEAARRTIIKSFMGFGSASITKKRVQANNQNPTTGFRANSNRSGSTPAHDWKNYYHHLDSFIERLRGVIIENRPAQDVMKAHDGENSLHYVDPPYLPETRDAGGDYAHEMTRDDHEELLTFLKELQGKVILSGYNSPFYDRLLKNWRKIERKAYADGARERVECLWLSPNIRQNTLL